MKPDLQVSTRKTGVQQVYEGLKASGVNFAVYLPDSALYPLIPLLEEDPEVQTVACSREDEGIAIAAGAYLGGKITVAFMESSGVGFAPLILARTQLQRTPMLILASHSKALGLHFDYHGATRVVGEGVFEGLNIPYVVVDDPSKLKTFVEQAVATIRSQKTSVGLVIPAFVLGGD